MKSYQSLGVGPAALSPKSPYSVSLLLSWCRPLLLLVAFCLSMAVVMPAWAGDGSLDPTFSNLGAGVQKIPIIRGKADYQDINGNANGNSLASAISLQLPAATVPSTSAQSPSYPAPAGWISTLASRSMAKYGPCSW